MEAGSKNRQSGQQGGRSFTCRWSGEGGRVRDAAMTHSALLARAHTELQALVMNQNWDKAAQNQNSSFEKASPRYNMVKRSEEGRGKYLETAVRMWSTLGIHTIK